MASPMATLTGAMATPFSKHGGKHGSIQLASIRALKWPSFCACPVTAYSGSQEGLQADPTESEASGLYLNEGAGYSCLCACWQVHWTNGHPIRSHGQPHGLKPAHFPKDEASAGAFKWPFILMAARFSSTTRNLEHLQPGGPSVPQRRQEHGLKRPATCPQ